MPKPVKKRPSSDPNKRAHQLLNEHLERLEGSQKPWTTAPDPSDSLNPAQRRSGFQYLDPKMFQFVVPPVEPSLAQVSAYMAKIGRKGGKASGAKRMTNLSDKERTAIAKKAAEARWAKRKRKAKHA